MGKKLLLPGLLIILFLGMSCSGKHRKEQNTSGKDTTKVEDASGVITYYHASLSVLNHLVNAKDINEVLGYMENRGKGVELTPILEITRQDTAVLMNPGDYFPQDVRRELVQNFRALFDSREQFYANFDRYLSYQEVKDYTKDKQLLDANYRLSIEMSDYKEVIFDILGPIVAKAEKMLLADDPLKDQIMAMRKMSATMRSIMNLYARRHGMDGVRIDVKLAELKRELESAEKLTDVSGYGEEMKTYRNFLSAVGAFIKDVQKARDKGEYNDADYATLMGYGLSII